MSLSCILKVKCRRELQRKTATENRVKLEILYMIKCLTHTLYVMFETTTLFIWDMEIKSIVEQLMEFNKIIND